VPIFEEPFEFTPCKGSAKESTERAERKLAVGNVAFAPTPRVS
jgi:hypothetical protein